MIEFKNNEELAIKHSEKTGHGIGRILEEMK